MRLLSRTLFSLSFHLLFYFFPPPSTQHASPLFCHRSVRCRHTGVLFCAPPLCANSLIHFTKRSLRGRPVPYILNLISLISSLSCPPAPLPSLCSVTLTQCHFLSKLGKRSRAKGIAACLMKHSGHFTCSRPWALYLSIMCMYLCLKGSVVASQGPTTFFPLPLCSARCHLHVM